MIVLAIEVRCSASILCVEALKAKSRDNIKSGNIKVRVPTFGRPFHLYPGMHVKYSRLKISFRAFDCEESLETVHLF